MPSLFPKLNKILYIDADTIITEDLSELYNTDITNYYVAGVRDYWAITNNPDYQSIIGIKSMDQYINSGVLLMNLDAMRKDNVEDKFNQYIDKNHCSGKHIGKFHDQDVINYVCHDKILHIPLKYNAMHACLYDYYCVEVHKWDISLFNNIKDFYGKKEWEEAVKSPTIIHFLGGHRPWRTPKKLPASSVWWKYAKKTDFFNEIVRKFRTRQNSYDMYRMINIEL